MESTLAGWALCLFSETSAAAVPGIPPGTPHVVAWPEGREDDRRHWHTACWSARGRRGVKVHRSKNAPRYG